MIQIFHQGQVETVDPAELVGPLAGHRGDEERDVVWYDVYICKCHQTVVKSSVAVALKQPLVVRGEVGNVG